MIFYHGTPLSGTKHDVAKFVTGRHMMVPFFRQDDLGAVAEFSSSFAFDNSAYSVWKRGKTLDAPGYLSLCREYKNHPRLDWCLIPDIVDGTERENDRLLSKWPPDLPGVPIWHLHESIDRLERLAKNYRRVALGSSGEFRTPNSRPWWKRMREALDRICDDEGRPICLLHGLRMTAPTIVARVPFASADSTTAARESSHLYLFGNYVPAHSWQRATVVADRMESVISPSVWSRP
jgi:hypothetical protein